MVWQRNDDQYGISRKVTRIPRAIRLAAVGLDQLAKNYSVRASTDGVLDEVELVEVLSTPKLVAALVSVGMWHETGHQCAKCVQPPRGGIVIHDFLEYNPDAASTKASQESKSVGGQHGNHIRWHAARRIVVAGCEWCESDMRSGSDRGRESDDESLRNPPDPVPDPIPETTTDQTHDLEVRHVITARADLTDSESFLVEQAGTLGIKRLPRVVAAIQGAIGHETDPALVIDTARAVILLAGKPVHHPEAYIEKASRDTPDTVRAEYTRVRANAPRAVVA